ncbi:MAG: EpsI family protein [Gemmataceae bacterium]|nr:EpsI family protein [Gemmataceae bacterium]
MTRWLVIVVAVAGLLAAAVFEGIRSNRWGASAETRAAAEKLNGIPITFGSWSGTETPLSEKVVRVAEATGYVSRVYEHRTTKARVSVLLLCGPSGPIGAHTPEYCYAGSGFAMRGEPVKKVLAPKNAPAISYWSAQFAKPTESLRVCWMWGVEGNWEASVNARFGLQSALFKLYVVNEEPITPTTGTNLAETFLTDFLPEVKKALSTPTAPNDPSDPNGLN